MKPLRVLLVIALVVAFSSVARAEPVPSYVALPPNYALGTARYERYDHFEITVPDPVNPRASQHLQPAGHYWQIQVTGNASTFTIPLWRPVLEHAGWHVLVASGQIVAQHAGASGSAWLKFSGGARFEVIDEAPPSTLVLPAPAATPETLAAGHDIPYLPPLPGMTQTTFRVDADRTEEMTGPITDGPFYVGPPVTHVDYHGSPELSNLEVQVVYAAAFAAAGWTMNYSNAGGMTVAHYAQHGRDIWAKLYGGNGELHIALSDIGANAAASRLRAALERDGHVALYGIYFDTDSATLRPDSEATLQQILALLHDVPTLHVEIQGHTDNTGAAAHNQTLSESRAASVRTWLTAHGIAAARLTSAGYGATRPVADNATAQGRALNRRVELARVGR